MSVWDASQDPIYVHQYRVSRISREEPLFLWWTCEMGRSEIFPRQSDTCLSISADAKTIICSTFLSNRFMDKKTEGIRWREISPIFTISFSSSFLKCHRWSHNSDAFMSDMLEYYSMTISSSSPIIRQLIGEQSRITNRLFSFHGILEKIFSRKWKPTTRRFQCDITTHSSINFALTNCFSLGWFSSKRICSQAADSCGTEKFIWGAVYWFTHRLNHEYCLCPTQVEVSFNKLSSPRFCLIYCLSIQKYSY